MADQIDYLLKLQADSFTGPANAATTATGNLDASVKRLGTNLNGLKTTTTSAGAGFSSLFDKVAHLGSNLANTVAGIQAAHKAFTWLKGSSDATKTSVAGAATAVAAAGNATRGLSSGAKLVAGAFGLVGVTAGGAVVGVAALTAATAAFAAVAAPVIIAITAVVGSVKAAFASVSQAANFESTAVAFEGLIGSAEGAKNTMQELTSFAANTPFELPEVTKSAQKLLGAGISADKLTGSMNSLGNVTAAFQGDLTTVATIFGQVVNKGKLYAEEIQQFGENGIPALQLLSESMGKTKAEIIAAATAGELSASDLAAAFDKAGGAGGKFSNAMARQAQTTKGLWSTLKDSIGQVFVTLGTPINDALRPLMRQAIALTDSFGTGLKNAIAIGRGVIAQGKIGEAIENAISLGAKTGLNALISLFMSLPGRLTGVLSTIGQAIKAALSGSFEVARNILSSFDPGKMQFDTSKEMDFFKQFLPGGAAATAATGGGGLADAIPAAAQDDEKEKKVKEKKVKERAATAADLSGVQPDDRHHIMGYNSKQRAVNPFLDHRSFKEFFGKDQHMPRFKGSDAFNEAFHPGRKAFLDGINGVGQQLENPGKLTRLQREKAAEKAAASNAKPRWDKVESIEKILSNLTVG